MKTPETTAEFYDEIAATYDEGYSNKVYLAENMVIKAMLKPLVKDSDTILDLGCGTGLVLDLLETPPQNYNGLDISPKMLHKLHEKHPGVSGLLPCAMEDMPTDWPDKADVITSLFDSFNLCLDPEEAIKRAAAVHKPDGLLFLTVANKLSAKHFIEGRDLDNLTFKNNEPPRELPGIHYTRKSMANLLLPYYHKIEFIGLNYFVNFKNGNGRTVQEIFESLQHESRELRAYADLADNLVVIARRKG